MVSFKPKNRLIERKKSGYELTAAGESLKQAASNMEHEVLAVDSNLGGRDAQLSGELRISAINNMASSILMPMFASFNRQYPDVELHLIVSNKYDCRVHADKSRTGGNYSAPLVFCPLAALLEV